MKDIKMFDFTNSEISELKENCGLLNKSTLLKALVIGRRLLLQSNSKSLEFVTVVHVDLNSNILYLLMQNNSIYDFKTVDYLMSTHRVYLPEFFML